MSFVFLFQSKNSKSEIACFMWHKKEREVSRCLKMLVYPLHKILLIYSVIVRTGQNLIANAIVLQVTH